VNGVDQIDSLLFFIGLQLLNLSFNSCEDCVDQVETQGLSDFGHLSLKKFSYNVPDLA
jgi:hypothetical protein